MTDGNWRDLDGLLAEGRQFPATKAAAIVTAVLYGLKRMHAEGRAHGAVDPAHVQLTDTDARLAPPSGAPMPDYAAPERHAGQPPSPAADVFSAGVVLYRLLTGQSPFSGPPASIPQRVQSMMPPPPSKVADVPAAFDEPVVKAMAKRPEARHADAQAFAQALAAALQASLPKRPPPPPQDEDATVVRQVQEDATVFRPVSADATVFQPAAADATVVQPPRPASAKPPPQAKPPQARRGARAGAVVVVVLALAAAVAWLVLG